MRDVREEESVGFEIIRAKVSECLHAQRARITETAL